MSWRPTKESLRGWSVLAALACGACGGETTAPAPSAAAVRLVAVAGNDQVFFPGVAVPERLTVRLVDSADNPVAMGGVGVNWEVVAGGGVVMSVDDATNATGFAFANWVLGPDTGANQVRATAAGLVPADFSARAALPGPIVFVSNRRTGIGGNEIEGFPGDLYVMNEDGTDVIPLFPTGTVIQELSDPAWSPDGSRILFVRGIGRPAGGVPGLIPLGMWTIRADGTLEVQVPASGFPPYVKFFEDPTWNPFGSRIVATLAAEGQQNIPPEVLPGALHVMNNQGIGVQPLTALGPARSPDWDSVTSRIAYVCISGALLNICAANNDGTNNVQLTDGGSDIDPAWSPDGARILFARDSVNAGGVWVMNADGTGLVQVTGGRATSPSWSPDGTQFVYTLDDGGRFDVWLFDFASSQATNLTNSSSRDREADWRW